MKRITIFGIIVILLGLLCFVPLPVYSFHVLILTLFYAFVGTAWNLMCGYGGRLSLGHSAYIAIGAYITLLLFKDYHVVPWAGMIVSGVISVIVISAIAYPCFRFGIKGPYFTLASIAVAEIVQNIITSLRDVTGGSLGVSLPYRESSLLYMQFDERQKYYLLILIAWVIAVFIVWRLERLRYYLVALREDDAAATSLGVPISKTLLTAATISAFLVSLGGTFYVQYFRYIDPYSVAGFGISLNMALVTIIGGSGTIFGPSIGALILIPLSEYLRLGIGGKMPGLHLVIYGAIMIAVIIFMPRGVGGLFESIITKNKSNKKHSRKLSGAVDKKI
jgi:branched-chain amino acid transport system permease protein